MLKPMDNADFRALLSGTLASTPANAAVVCLCAAWCGTCREFQPGFEQAAQEHPQIAFRWVDIENEADELGDIDIETFPTLLIGNASKVHFAGPVLPQPAQIGRLLRSLGL
ncbi:thioredoxin family protein [Ottowia sp. VDI28]|uniref:thioredoxin family protein n=2 Tax=unclassified Ottowia TaxID=2645081 RepID=UPI003C2BCC0C